MTEGYEPPSDFLKGVINESVPLEGSSFGCANFLRLIEMTRDADVANRDWATLLLAQSDFDDEAARTALRAAADDSDFVVRAEAILGLANRSIPETLSLVQRELAGEMASIPLMEAAEALADPKLIEALSAFSEGDDWIAEAARRAMEACSRGVAAVA